MYFLIIAINRRRVQDLRTQLAITSNPHSKHPEELWRQLNSLDTTKDLKPPQFDASGFANFKAKLANSKKVVVK